MHHLSEKTQFATAEIRRGKKIEEEEEEEVITGQKYNGLPIP